MKQKRVFHGLTAGILALALTSCTQRPNAAKRIDSSSGDAAAVPALEVQVTPVVSRVLERNLLLPGDLLAYQDVAIFPKVQGFVQSIRVDRGSKVRQGQLLIQMVAPELVAHKDESDARARAAESQSAEAGARLLSVRSQRLEAEARLAADEAIYARLRAASLTPGVVAGNDLEIAQRSLEASRARLAAAKENEKAAEAQVQAVMANEKAALDAAGSSRDIEAYLRITAPFDGVVTERNVHEGSLAGPAFGPAQIPMLRIQEVSRLRLAVYVPEAEVGGIVPESRVSFTVPAFQGETFNGTIRHIAHALDPKTRTMPVELDVVNASGRLAPGMYSEVQWPSRHSQPSLFVPPSAVGVNTERTFVIRIRDGTADWVDVRRGTQMGNLIEIFGEIASGDQVAIRGTDELRHGTKVSVKPR